MSASKRKKKGGSRTGASGGGSTSANDLAALQQHASHLKRPAQDKASEYYQHVLQETLTFDDTSWYGRGSCDIEFPDNFLQRVLLGIGVAAFYSVTRLLAGMHSDRINYTSYAVHMFWFSTSSLIDALFRYNMFISTNHRAAYVTELAFHLLWLLNNVVVVAAPSFFGPLPNGRTAMWENLRIYLPGASLSVRVVLDGM